MPKGPTGTEAPQARKASEAPESPEPSEAPDDPAVPDKASLTLSDILFPVGKSKKALMPKSKCCQDRPRCTRCPIRMLKDGTLPDGYTVRKRRLVRV